ncbi:MAG: hypothetical protein B5766_05100 [Candidatus Lumbricidophila eiseniae]|uniref:ABC transmembrane type-1 domain-containing protein n=1 Tax=Candidatus Lumbricidiphila eiseniae TaxID=1969409 RepID=A0A2A6FSL6_9MICO|nr:MAG: hypothetical protein B5766_05100 [Candidatus Lumbricidophila eiseniae]
MPLLSQSSISITRHSRAKLPSWLVRQPCFCLSRRSCSSLDFSALRKRAGVPSVISARTLRGNDRGGVKFPAPRTGARALRGNYGAGALRHGILVVAGIIALAPVYLMITGSVKTQDAFLTSPWALPQSLSFHAYDTVFNDQFMQWFMNSMIVTAGAVALTMVCGSLAAWGLVNWPFRGRDTILGVTVSLMVVPPVVLLIPLFQAGAALGWISTFQIVILIYLGLMLPFSIYLLANFFTTIPAALLEAAALDGASPLQVFRKIVLPLSGPPIATLVVVNLLWAWNELLLALVFLQSHDTKTLMVGITGFHSRYSLDIPSVMAGMTVATLPLVIAYLFGQRYFIKGLTAGGLKGE